ncbi:MAG: 16S rRNA (uracil(1498)-N(3))-methyltransferase [Spirochaetaceae bacterium]|nr:MAG: 16S rRNA (uracil(1498)-N(3))-methyltransferase [Spirochaetaceae bacterium]
MKQFVLPDRYDGEQYVRLTGREYHYLVRVRRCAVGDSFPAIDRLGGTYHATVDEVGVDSVSLRISQNETELSDDVRIVLYQCVPKARKLDGIIRQATEIGVTAVVPVKSRHAIPVPGEKQYERWVRIAREAVQQSGATRVPEIRRVIALEEIVPIAESHSLGLFFHQIPLENSSLHGYLTQRPGTVSLVVGPEGGLSDDEIALLRQKGFLPAYLGPRVLRTETAAVFAIAAIRVILMESSTWTAS